MESTDGEDTVYMIAVGRKVRNRVIIAGVEVGLWRCWHWWPCWCVSSWARRFSSATGAQEHSPSQTGIQDERARRNWAENSLGGMSLDLILAQRRAEYAEALDRALSKIVAHLANMPEVEQVILFGSYAAGRRDLFTDLDLLVVMSSEQDFVRRTAELYQQVAAGVDLDLLVYTPEEFERLRRHGFVRQALETGRVLHEKKRAGRG